MLAVLLSSVTAAFIPFSFSSRLWIESINETLLHEAVANNPVCVIACTTNDDSRTVTTFIHMEPLFPDVKFLLVNPKTLRNFTKNRARYPSITIVRNGEVEVTVGPCLDDSSMLSVVDLWLYKDRPVLTDRKKLQASFNGGPRTIIATESKFEVALEVAKSTAKTVGPSNVVVVSEATGKLFKINHCGIFRRDDSVMEPLKKCSAWEYTKAARPLYSAMTRFTFDAEDLVVAMRTNDPAKARDIDALFAQLGEHFKDVQFVSVPQIFNQRLEGVIHDSTFSSMESGLVVVHFKDGYYYNISTAFPEEMRTGQFDANLWGNTLVEFLRQIKAGNVEKTLLSELDDSASTTNLKKLVGTKFHQIIDNNTRDSIILYIRQGSDRSTRTFHRFKRLAQQNGDVMFYIYDVVANQLPEGNAVTRQSVPVAVMYPKHGGTPNMIAATSTNLFRWGMSKHGSTPLEDVKTPKLSEVVEAERLLDKYAEGILPAFTEGLRKDLAQFHQDEL